MRGRNRPPKKAKKGSSRISIMALPLNRDCGPSHATNDLRPLLMAPSIGLDKREMPNVDPGRDRRRSSNDP